MRAPPAFRVAAAVRRPTARGEFVAVQPAFACGEVGPATPDRDRRCVGRAAPRVQIYLALLPVPRDTLFLIPTGRGEGVPK